MAKTPKKYLDINGLSYYNNNYINTIVNAIDETKQDKVPDIIYTINSSNNITCNKTYNEIMSIIQEKSANGEFLYVLAQQSTGAMFATGFSITQSNITFFSEFGNISHNSNNEIDLIFYEYDTQISSLDGQISALQYQVNTLDISDLSDNENRIPSNEFRRKRIQ